MEEKSNSMIQLTPIQLTPNVIALLVDETSTGHRVVDFMGHDVLKFEDDIFTSQRPLPNGKWHLIGLLSDCLENETLAEKVVEKKWMGYLDYNHPQGFAKAQATDSFESLISSHSLDLTKTWVLLTNKKETV